MAEPFFVLDELFFEGPPALDEGTVICFQVRVCVCFAFSYVCVRCLEGLHVPVFHRRVNGSAVCSTSIKSETHRNSIHGLGKDTTQGGHRMEQHLE